jgi:integrase
MAEVVALTDAVVDALPFSTRGQYIVRDAALAGFFLVVGASTKTFTVQVAMSTPSGRSSRRKSLGRFGELSARGARAAARKVISELASAEPEKALVRNVTLKEAWDRYERLLREHGRSERTIDGYRHHVYVYFASWHSTALIDLAKAPDKVDALHRHLTEKHGRYAANGGMRTLSAIFNNAARTNLELRGLNPVKAVRFNKELRRKTAMLGSDLSDWFDQLDKFDNKVRRHFHVLTLLTGSRPAALRCARWEHVDFIERTWHFPAPKGGSERAFDIPICARLEELLLRLKADAGERFPLTAGEWLFPAESETGHMSESKEPRRRLAKWGNDLRQSFRTFATASGTSEVLIHILMNHAMKGVSVGYLNLKPIWRELTEAQACVILRIEGDAGRSVVI